MSNPLKSFEVTLKFRLDINEIRAEDVEPWEPDERFDAVKARQNYIEANQALQRALLEHPELITRLLPDILADMIEGDARNMIYGMFNSKLRNVSNNERELIGHVEGEARGWLQDVEDAGLFPENTELYADSLSLAGISATIETL